MKVVSIFSSNSQLDFFLCFSPQNINTFLKHEANLCEVKATRLILCTSYCYRMKRKLMVKDTVSMALAVAT